MNDETQPQQEPSPQNTETHSTTKPRNEFQLSVVILIAIVIVLAALLVINNATPKGKPTESEELRAARERLNTIEKLATDTPGTLPLPPGIPESKIADADAVAKRLAEDSQTLIDFSRGVREVLASRDHLLSERSSEITKLLANENSLRQQIELLKQERDKARIEASTANTALTQLKEAETRATVLAEQLKKLTISSSDLEKSLAQTTAERDALAAKIRELQNQINQANLFANNEQELFQESQQLFRELQNLEGKPDSDLVAAYSKFGANLRATVITRMEFPVGASDLQPNQLEDLKNFSAEAPPNATFFVVGYASKSGNADDNRSLSSNRATSVAQALLTTKQPSQRVQAAYLGPTDRFGSKFPERNQICEIWQILPP